MNPPIIVTGFGRCGTSMIMQMLTAGGIPCTGKAPAYEDASIALAQIPAPVLETLRGKAVKQLDLHRFGLANSEPWVILMKRNPVEQSKSLAKFMRVMLNVDLNRDQIRALRNDLISTRKPMKKVLAGVRCLPLSFEDVLANPLRAADELAKFTRLGGAFNAMAAAGVVKQRGAACLNNMNLELGLLGEIA